MLILKEDLFPQRNFMEPKFRFQEAVRNVEKKFKKKEWYKTCGIEVSDKELTSLVVICHHAVDDTKLPNVLFGYHVTYTWDYKEKNKSIFKIYKEYVQRYGNQHWFYDAYVDECTYQRIIVLTRQTPYPNPDIYPEVYQSTEISYRRFYNNPDTGIN